jgi:hypothetical protein
MSAVLAYIQKPTGIGIAVAMLGASSEKCWLK